MLDTAVEFEEAFESVKEQIEGLVAEMRMGTEVPTEYRGNVINPKNYIVFELSEEQFETVQWIVSEAGLSPASLQENIHYIADRENSLDPDFPYCKFGAFATDEITFWYETTRGTILSVSFDTSGGVQCSVMLPKHRENGHHHQQIVMVLEGMTLTQHRNWNNCLCMENKAQYAPEYRDFLACMKSNHPEVFSTSSNIKARH
jgi:hypothetical protein